MALLAFSPTSQIRPHVSIPFLPTGSRLGLAAAVPCPDHTAQTHSKRRGGRRACSQIVRNASQNFNSSCSLSDQRLAGRHVSTSLALNLITTVTRQSCSLALEECFRADGDDVDGDGERFQLDDCQSVGIDGVQDHGHEDVFGAMVSQLALLRDDDRVSSLLCLSTGFLGFLLAMPGSAMAGVACVMGSQVQTLNLGDIQGGQLGFDLFATVANLGLATEPANALSLPTWIIHVSSVLEWVIAMTLVWKYGDSPGRSAWKGLAWGMIPSLGGAMCACTWHFFYNSESLEVLVAAQGLFTLIGNFTLWFAAYRIFKQAKA